MIKHTNTRWEENDYEDLHNALLECGSLQNVAKTLGRSIKAVQQKCYQLKIPCTPEKYREKFPASPATPPKEVLHITLLTYKAVIQLPETKTVGVLQKIERKLTELSQFWPKECKAPLAKIKKAISYKLERILLESAFLKSKHLILDIVKRKNLQFSQPIFS